MPNSGLTALMVDHAAREGIKVIDLLRGGEPYKKLWHAEWVPTYGFSMPRLARSSSLMGIARSGKKAA
jgi:CelD/BcsL family acetyltransferase involved in cellulose biosynthesis